MARSNNARFKKGPLYEANRKKMEDLSDDNFINALKLDLKTLKLELQAEILKEHASELTEAGNGFIKASGELNNMHENE